MSSNLYIHMNENDLTNTLDVDLIRAAYGRNDDGTWEVANLCLDSKTHNALHDILGPDGFYGMSDGPAATVCDALRLIVSDGDHEKGRKEQIEQFITVLTKVCSFQSARVLISL